MPVVLRRVLLALFIVALVLCIAAAGGYGLLQTAPGQAWLAASLSRWISTPATRITIESIGGSIPFDIHVPRIELADENGAWLTIEDAELAIAPRALLARRLEVRRLAAQSLTVHRIPTSSGPAPSGRLELPSMPRLPLDINVDTLRIEQIHLAPDILGEPLTAMLVASGHLAGEALEANLLVRRIDETQGRASVSIDLQRSGQLAVNAEVVEPTGRVAQKILGTDQPAPLMVTARGDGRLDSWRGTLSARAGELARLDAEIAIERRDLLRVTTKGELDVGGLRPTQFAALIPQAISFTGAVETDGNVLTLEALDLASGALTVNGRGRHDIASAQLSGEATANLTDLAPLGTAVAMPLDGSGQVHIAVDGSLGAPHARATLEARDVRSGGLAAKHLSAQADLVSEQRSWRLIASGALEDLAIAGAGVPMPQEIPWDLRASGDTALTRIEVEHISTGGAGIAITGSGQVSSLDQTPQIAGTARVDIADLDELSPLAGISLRGSLALTADAKGTAAATTMTLRGETKALSAGAAALDALFGPSPSLSATLSRQADGTIAINAARLDGANVAITGQASISGDLKRIDGTARMELPRLEPLGAAINVPLAGAVSADAGFRGALLQPAINVEAYGEALQAQGWRLDRITTRLSLAGAGGTDGELRATFKAGTLEGRAAARFALPSPARLSISDLTISAPSTTLRAALDVALDTSLVSGTITGRVTDLAAWSALAGRPLAGQADLRVALAARNGQSAELGASARGLRLDNDTVIAHLQIKARLADLFGVPWGRASLDGSGIAAAGLRIETTHLSAQSVKAGFFNVKLQASGALSPEFESKALRLSADGEISIGDAQQRLRVARLAARLGDYDIVSRAPFVLTSGTRGIRLEGLDWRIGDGQLTAAGARLGDVIELRMQARGLPLALARSIAPTQPLDGALDASLALSGTTVRPEGTLEATLRGLRFATGRADVPPLGVTLHANWKNAVLALDGRVDGPAGTRLDLSGTLPLVIDPQTTIPAVPRGGAIRLAARGDGLLESWEQALPIGEDQISGRYAIDVQVRGTIAAPEAGGRLTINEGRYLNFAAGTELRNLELELVGDGRRFTLRRLSATDTTNGRIRADGAIDLAGASGPTIDVAAEFSDLQAVRRDELTATADGRLRLFGTVESATLSGQIRVQRAEIRIPERLPPHIARFDVIEINSKKNIVLSVPEQSQSPSILHLDLQLEIPARAFVRGRGLDSEWRGSLQIGGSVDAPTLTGSISVVRGDFALLGKSFVLTEGTITFLGDAKIDPQIKVVAEHRAAEITARATITGTPTAPVLNLSSQPELPQDEVLARVLFGRGAGQITPTQGLQLAQAAATLAGGGPGVLDRLRTTIGLDRLDFSGGDNASSGTSGPTITGGKYVSDSVFVGVEQGTTSQSTRTKVEIELTPNVTVESSVGANAAAGVGVNWRWDY